MVSREDMRAVYDQSISIFDGQFLALQTWSPKKNLKDVTMNFKNKHQSQVIKLIVYRLVSKVDEFISGDANIFKYFLKVIIIIVYSTKNATYGSEMILVS